MKHTRIAPVGIACIAVLVGCSACNRLALIGHDPEITPEAFLAGQPHQQITLLSKTFILIQPSSTVLVYAAGLLTLGVGIFFIRVRHHQRARLWWGVGLLLSGVGALLAGTSHQAFGYEIKCAGRPFCTWTSWWEVAYLLFTFAGMNALLVGVAWSCAKNSVRGTVFRFAIMATLVYSAVVLCGAFIPAQFLVSFEFMMLASAPTLLVALILTAGAFYVRRDRSALALLKAWAAFVPAMAAYLLALMADITPHLWSRGIWFTENDVLHVGMILWILFVALTLPTTITDRPLSGR